MTALPDWAVREPDESPGDWAFRLLVATSVRAVANAEPGWCRCALMPRLEVHVCDLHDGQPLRLTGPHVTKWLLAGSFRPIGTSPVPVQPRGCGTCHDGPCIHERN